MLTKQEELELVRKQAELSYNNGQTASYSAGAYKSALQLWTENQVLFDSAYYLSGIVDKIMSAYHFNIWYNIFQMYHGIISRVD